MNNYTANPTLRTPRCYRQFALSLGKESPYIFSKFDPLYADTRLLQTLSMGPSVSVLMEFDCTKWYVSHSFLSFLVFFSFSDSQMVQVGHRSRVVLVSSESCGE